MLCRDDGRAGTGMPDPPIDTLEEVEARDDGRDEASVVLSNPEPPKDNRDTLLVPLLFCPSTEDTREDAVDEGRPFRCDLTVTDEGIKFMEADALGDVLFGVDFAGGAGILDLADCTRFSKRSI